MSNEQLTFTEQEIKEVQEFINFVFTKANWNVSGKEMFDFTRLYTKIVQHLKKCEGYIMELREVKNPVKKEKSK